MSASKIVGYSIYVVVFGGLFCATVIAGGFWFALLVWGSSIVVSAVLSIAGILIKSDEKQSK